MVVFRVYTGLIENPVEKNMEDERESGFIGISGSTVLEVSPATACRSYAR